MTSAAAEPFPRARRKAVAAAAWAFVLSIAWQVATQRDDWPLSSFPMYSTREGPVTSRSFVVGVSEQGEFPLTDTLMPAAGARLRHLNRRLSRSDARQREFIDLIRTRYDAQRAEHTWPELQGIRAYTETWKIAQGLAGIDTPKRKLTDSLYIPPRALLQQLERERQGEAHQVETRSVPPGDVPLELEPSACLDGCEVIEASTASKASALRLSAADDEDEPAASVTAQLPLAAGTWSLFVRMRTPPKGGGDRLRVSLDGEPLGGKAGVGNYEDDLGKGAWVWASSAPGVRALDFQLKAAGPHVLRLESARAVVEIDQLWLARGRRELPTWNAAVAP